jgi:hypothetical protein
LEAEMVNVDVPTVVGLPESPPVAAFTVNPSGSEPDARPNVGVGLPEASNVYA